MRQRAYCLTAIMALACAGRAHAQPRMVRASAWIVPPTPAGRIMIFSSMGSSWGNPYALLERRAIIQVVAPEQRPALFGPNVDVSGIDLDVAPPPWAHEFEKAPLPGLKPRPQEAPAKHIEQIKAPPAKGKPIEPAQPPAHQEPPPAPPAPNLDPAQEGLRLMLAGLTAFRGQEYGLAARKFSQAIEADPKSSRAYFFLGQAHFALGKYSDAVQAIGLGLGLDPIWPKMPFRPRFDLYADHPEDWQRHTRWLMEAQVRQPNHVGYLFLLAHQRWFDEQRDDAIKLFQQVRPRVADPVLVDLFLKAKGS